MFSRRKSILISLAATAAALSAGESASRIVGATATQKKFLADDPLGAEPKPHPIKDVKSIDIDLLYDFVDESFVVQHDEKKQIRKGDVRARNVNTLGEVPDSGWYTNRNLKRRMTIEELVRGPGNTNPPDPHSKWNVVSAKNDGVTPGIRIKDAHGNQYLLKFDPPDYPELASAADVIGSKVYYALGYNTPENYIARFRREQLTITESSSWRDSHGKKHQLTDQMIDKLLANQPKDSDGQYRAMASRWVPGKAIGPYVFEGTRSDDPNDIVPHELRRELRGMKVVASWLNDTDAKSINTLDSLVGEPGAQYIKHFRIDWGASLGSDSLCPKDVRRGHDYFIDPKATLVQAISFGFYVPGWMRDRYPSVTGVGAFDYQSFDASKWKSNYPAKPFLLMDDDDAFWAAKQVMAFSDAEIRALVETGQYSDPRATDWITKCLIERRDKIGRAWLFRGLALDRFRVEKGRIEFEDLVQKYGISAPLTYHVQWSMFDNSTGKLDALASVGSGQSIPGSAPHAGFLAATIVPPAELGKPGAPQVTVYLRATGNDWSVVGIDRRIE
jgi:hypothetical protein